MNADAVREWLRRAPFLPFRLKLSNGDSYDIFHPEFLLLGKNLAVVYNDAEDKFAFVSLVHINNIETLEAVGQPDAR